MSYEPNNAGIMVARQYIRESQTIFHALSIEQIFGITYGEFNLCTVEHRLGLIAEVISGEFVDYSNNARRVVEKYNWSLLMNDYCKAHDGRHEGTGDLNELAAFYLDRRLDEILEARLRSQGFAPEGYWMTPVNDSDLMKRLYDEFVTWQDRYGCNFVHPYAFYHEGVLIGALMSDDTDLISTGRKTVMEIAKAKHDLFLKEKSDNVQQELEGNSSPPDYTEHQHTVTDSVEITSAPEDRTVPEIKKLWGIIRKHLLG